MSVSSKIRRCAVFVYQCAIALATRGRAPAADPPKSLTLLVFSRFWGSGAGKKEAKITRRRMARERRGAESSVVSMETPYYKIIY